MLSHFSYRTHHALLKIVTPFLLRLMVQVIQRIWYLQLRHIGRMLSFFQLTKPWKSQKGMKMKGWRTEEKPLNSTLRMFGNLIPLIFFSHLVFSRPHSPFTAIFGKEQKMSHSKSLKSVRYNFYFALFFIDFTYFVANFADFANLAKLAEIADFR